MMNRSTPNLTDLVNKIDQHFNNAELRLLCFQLNNQLNFEDELAYANLPSGEKYIKALALVEFMNRRMQLEALIGVLKQKRPNVDWTETTVTIKLPNQSNVRNEHFLEDVPKTRDRDGAINEGSHQNVHYEKPPRQQPVTESNDGNVENEIEKNRGLA